MDLLLFGIQGSGKGTQARRLAEEHGYVIFEAGGELRRLAASKTPLGEKVSSSINQGNLVPFEIIMQVVQSFAEEHQDEKILFDGMPRDREQMQAFDALMTKLKRDFVCINIALKEEEAVQRIMGRAKVEGREDDANEETIRHRMQLFHDKTEPVIEAYNAKGKVLEVDGNGSMDDVYQRILKVLEFSE